MFGRITPGIVNPGQPRVPPCLHSLGIHVGGMPRFAPASGSTTPSVETIPAARAARQALWTSRADRAMSTRPERWESSSPRPSTAFLGTPRSPIPSYMDEKSYRDMRAGDPSGVSSGGLGICRSIMEDGLSQGGVSDRTILRRPPRPEFWAGDVIKPGSGRRSRVKGSYTLSEAVEKVWRGCGLAPKVRLEIMRKDQASDRSISP